MTLMYYNGHNILYYILVTRYRLSISLSIKGFHDLHITITIIILFFNLRFQRRDRSGRLRTIKMYVRVK
jgi:hypothetical protein